MWAVRRLAVISIVAAGIAYAQEPDPGANPFSVVFSNSSSIGPDGPWNFIPQAIDYPDQVVNMLPSLAGLSLAVGDNACSSQSAACPLPIPTLWQESGAWDVSGGPKTISKTVDGSSWEKWTSSLLRLKGNGKFFQERITLHENGVETAAAFLDNHGMMLSESYQATFPGGAAYTLDSGFLSLYGKEDTISWSTATNGSKVTFNRTLPDAYLAGYSPSISYGLHIGSATHQIDGSLVVGGYDSSRCIGEPIVSEEQSVQLTQVTLGVAYGGSAYTKSISPSTNLLKGGSLGNSLEIYPDPGVPYMYLPKDTCDAIAAYLPVTYNADFNLYFWNTQSKAYEDIISSPHYMDFTFSADGKTSTISVPFALLNLTLESPLVSSSTPYFPCSPLDTSAGAPYHLGRAFLQGAFLAQNWQSGKLFLAQAPGPDLSMLSPYIKKIASGDTSISGVTNPPIWEDTWSSTLKALPGKAPGESEKKSGLSGGAIAGIVIGVLAGLALVAGVVVWMVLRRRRRARQQQQQHQVASETAHHDTYGNGEVYAYRKEGYTPPVYEVDSQSSPRVEMEGRQVSELDAQGNVK